LSERILRAFRRACWGLGAWVTSIALGIAGFFAIIHTIIPLSSYLARQPMSNEQSVVLMAVCAVAYLWFMFIKEMASFFDHRNPNSDTEGKP
jgi:hypothetical protein